MSIEGAIDILSQYLTSELMAALWLLVMSISIFVAYRTRVWAMLLIAGGAVGLVIFYTYTSFHLWPSSQVGHVYGRLAHITLMICIIATARMMYKGVIRLRG